MLILLYYHWAVWRLSQVQCILQLISMSIVIDGTTGHEYDGIQEYDNPMPRWWVKMYWMGVAFFICYVALYPALGAYKGYLGWTSHGEHDKDKAEYDAKYGPIFAAYAQKPVEELAKDAAAMKIAGRLYANNCAACHGADARGAKGFPNLTACPQANNRRYLTK